MSKVEAVTMKTMPGKDFDVFSDEGNKEQCALRKIHLICNPYSGGQKGLKLLAKVMPMFQAADVEVSVKMTQYAGHALDIVRDLKLWDAVVAIGGDGTMHEVANGMLQHPVHDRVPIGCIPGGSGNTFAWDIRMRTWDQAVQSILKGCVRGVDVQEVSRLDKPDDPPHYSINMCGWGLPANNLKIANSLRWLGSAQYNLAAYKQILSKENHAAKITLDDGTVLEGKFVMIQSQVNVMMGELAAFCPLAKMDDGLVDLVVVRKAGIMQVAKTMVNGIKGKHLGMNNVDYHQVRSYTVEGVASKSGAVNSGDNTVNLDGELKSGSPMTVKCLSRALKVFTGI